MFLKGSEPMKKNTGAQLALYLAFVMGFSCLTGIVVNLIL